MNRRPNSIEIFDRQPPFNIEAERGVLGSILILPDVMDDVASIIAPSDFYEDANATLFSRMVAMHASGEAIDITTLVDRLKTNNEFDAIGGTSYFARITNTVPNAAHAIYYAKIVRRKADYRAILNATTTALGQAYNEDHEPERIRHQLVEQLDGDVQRYCGNAPKPAAKIAAEAVSEIKRRREHGEARGLATGFADVDETTGGLHDGELIILAARPGMGKTSAALQIAMHQAKRNATVFVVSMEMSSRELMTRVFCAESGVDHQRIRSNRVDEDEVGLLEQTAGRIAETALHLSDPPTMTVADIRTEARRLRKRCGLALVIVDYLTRLAPANQRLQRHQQVGQMSGDLKRLARELNIPVLCLAQLNRQAEATGTLRPQLAHLRDSGDIEQDADCVWFLHRPGVYKTNDLDLTGKAELIIGKNRNGPTGTIQLLWRPETTEFRDINPRHLEEEF